MRSICELKLTSIRGDGTPLSLEGSMAMEKSIVNRPFRMETPKKNGASMPELAKISENP